jgi:CO/xanthine dehydrogenase Mo-binding subunit
VSRLDARAKATGAAGYVADVVLPGMAYATVVRADVPHARITAIRREAAVAVPGVLGVFVADELAAGTYGRQVRDVPVLARGEVRFAGERVVAVVAETKAAADEAASLVEVDLEPLPAVYSPEEAWRDGAPLVHEAPWEYPGAAARPEDGRNVQSNATDGSLEAAEAALARAAYVVERTYVTPAVHQGYLEPQSCVASMEDGRLRVWLTNKSPYRLRLQLSACLGLDPEAIVVEPAFLGGDFGGKGSPGDAPLCAELSRLTGRPVALTLRYSEDLTATDVRHPSRTRVRIGADEAGRFVGLVTEAVLDGGAYAGFKPAANANLHGSLHSASAYRMPVYYAESKVAYTNNSPRGHMRSPGSPQAVFALESAIDELALEAGLDPLELRRRNLLETGEADPYGARWVEARGRETLDAALSAAGHPDAPPGWRVGRGVGVYVRQTPLPGPTSLRLSPLPGGGLRVELPIPETGTGSHTVVRERLAGELGLSPEQVEVVQVPTEELPDDQGVGGSRVTAAMSAAAAQAAAAWREQEGAPGGARPITVNVTPSRDEAVASYIVQLAQVAVDPETGELRVLELVSAVDVAEIVNEKAHQMQIDGGAAMGYGYACLEDLYESDGQVWAANLGEFKLPSVGDLPALRTALVRGGKGVASANVKAIGELPNVPTAGAIANAVAAAGVRVRQLPITAERIYDALRRQAAPSDGEAARGDQATGDQATGRAPVAAGAAGAETASR